MNTNVHDVQRLAVTARVHQDFWVICITGEDDRGAWFEHSLYYRDRDAYMQSLAAFSSLVMLLRPVDGEC